ncbi:unnamed protein product, partial [marine sediment metagenome]
SSASSTGNESSTTSHEDTFTHASFGLVSGDIVHGVGVNVWGAKTEAGSADMKVVLHKGSTSYYSAAYTPTTTYERAFQLWDEDPDTVAAWTYNGPDSAHPGYERQ